MIFKIVFASEIHLYDIKQNNSLSDLKIQMIKIFKKLPSQFQLYYKDAEQDHIYLNCDQDIKNLQSQSLGLKKMTKLFVQQASLLFQKELCFESEHNKICPQLIQSIKNQKENDEIIQSVYAEKQTFLQTQTEIKNIGNFSGEQLSKAQEHQKQKVIQKEQNKFLVQKLQLQVKEYQNQNQRTRIWDICDLKEPKAQLNKQKINSTSQRLQQSGKLILKNDQIKIKNQNQKQSIIQLPSKKQDQIGQRSNQSHNAKCDQCQHYPIIGVRYKCSVCENYDLCQKCQTTSGHIHPFLKIRYTYQTPLSMKVQLAKKIEQVAKVQFDLSGLNIGQKNERINLIASQISEMLSLQFKECYQFVSNNDKYTKQTIISLLVQKVQNQSQHPNQKKKNFWQRIFG